MLIIVMKHYIYSSKCKAKELCFANFVNVIDYWYNVERINSYRSDKMVTFQKKWKHYNV